MVTPRSPLPRNLGARWSHAERCRRALLAAARRLHGVDFLVIKGMHIAFTYAAHPWDRSFVDADIVVSNGSFRRAVAALRSDPEFVLEDDDFSTKTWVYAPTGTQLDLHRFALPPFFGRMRWEALRARAATTEALGLPLLAPDAMDAACLAIAHYVKDGCPSPPARLEGDLRLLVDRAGITPQALAGRLVEHGLRRRGLVAFTRLCRDDPGWASWCEPLLTSPAERSLARWMLAAMEALAGSPLRMVLGRSCEDRAPAAVVGVSWGLALRVRDELHAAVHR